MENSSGKRHCGSRIVGLGALPLSTSCMRGTSKSKFVLATEGRHVAQCVDISFRPPKCGDREIVQCRFNLHDEKASANLFIGLGQSTQEFIARVPGYHGETIDPLQLLGRSAEVEITHRRGADSSMIYANVKPESVLWEDEPSPTVETVDDPYRQTVLITASHPKPGTGTTGTFFYRVIGSSTVYSKKAKNCNSGFDAAKTCVLGLLASANQKRVALRILVDLKPLATAQVVLEHLGRSSIEWMRGEELKRLLFRSLPKFDPAKKRPCASSKQAGINADWIEELA